MSSHLPESEWITLNQTLQQTIAAWRQAHPTATLEEIERVIDAQLAPVRARLIEETAQASSSQEWQPAGAAGQPCCPSCGTPLQPRGRHRRRLQTTGGATVELERSYGVCPTCGQGLFPPG